MQESDRNALSNIFRDRRFTEIRRNCWFGEVGGVRRWRPTSTAQSAPFAAR
jgi:hypothetical protein